MPTRTIVDGDLGQHGDVWATDGHPHDVLPTTFDGLVRIMGEAPADVGTQLSSSAAGVQGAPHTSLSSGLGCNAVEAMQATEGAMPRRRKHSTMAEILSEARSSPSRPPSRRLPPGIHDGQLIGSDGTTYQPVSSSIDPAEAARLVGEGAAVAFDECACGGTCGFIWASWDERLSLAKNPPVLRTHKGLDGVLSLWESPAGQRLVLAQGPVTWV